MRETVTCTLLAICGFFIGYVGGQIYFYWRNRIRARKLQRNILP